MTLVSPGKPARTVSKGVICDTEDQVETLYTCPANCRSEVTMLFCVNANGNTSALAKWYKSDTAEEYNLIGGKNLGTGDYVLLTGATLVLEPGDQIRCVATGNASPTLDYMCTVTETFQPVG
jgi:hypothetical protein